MLVPVNESMFEYKGYVSGSIHLDSRSGTLSGTAAGLRDVIHFESARSEDLVRAFRESVDSYLEFCMETNQKPDQTAKSVEWVAGTDRSSAKNQWFWNSER